MWQFTCDVENDEYERGKLPEHTYSNTTGKKHVQSRSCYPKVNKQNCGNDWRVWSKTLLRYKWINYWRHMLKEDRIISKSFQLFILYCTESLSDVSCFVSYRSCVGRATTRIHHQQFVSNQIYGHIDPLPHLQVRFYTGMTYWKVTCWENSFMITGLNVHMHSRQLKGCYSEIPSIIKRKQGLCSLCRCETWCYLSGFLFLSRILIAC